MARAGAIVGIGHDGATEIEHVLIRPEDRTAHRTAALRTMLVDTPSIALAAVTE